MQKDKARNLQTKMKPMVKRKRTNEQKDYMSETISFVIKGKLTPIKSTYTKKVIGNKKKKSNNTNNTTTKSQRAVERCKTKKTMAKDKKTNVTKKRASSKIDNKTKLKKKKVDKVVCKKKVGKKVEESGEDKKNDDIKTKQTIEKLLKQANKALKQSKSAKIKPSKPKKGAVKEEIVEKAEANADDTSTSDDMTLNELRRPKSEPEEKKTGKRVKRTAATSKAPSTSVRLRRTKTETPIRKRSALPSASQTQTKTKENLSRKMKLLGLWNAPKRHRVASLNALAKVHCLYENETRSGNSNAVDEPKIEPATSSPFSSTSSPTVHTTTCEPVVPTRTLRSLPGLRAVGKHWDMHDDTTSSSEETSGTEEVDDNRTIIEKSKKDVTTKKIAVPAKKPTEKKRRNRAEIMMDLKDMVVRKRMASLNATAILAASYSMEKRKGSKSGSETDESSDYFIASDDDVKHTNDDDVKKEEDGKVIEMCTAPNKKVAVILNQDTDVTITGVYVNSTTRSTHHEGYCSIAGMQYRISATSHTQTAAAAVATETLLQSSAGSTHDNSNTDSCKSYTPLDALSNMQPPPGPGIQHMTPPQHVLPLSQHPISPSGRPHGCTSSAFSAPPPHNPAGHTQNESAAYIHGYYQPAGPLINVPHGHTQPPPPPPTKSASLSETSTSPAITTTHQPHPPPANSGGGDSSDSEVIITSITTAKEPPPSLPAQPPQQPPGGGGFRFAQYPPAYPYPYSPHYYPTPPPPPPPPASYAHHDICYPPTAAYLHHKYPPTAYRRYLTGGQYYAPTPPDIYGTPPTQQVVTTNPTAPNANTFQPSATTLIEPYPPPPPPPTLVETYPPHPPQHYYPTYGGPAPPSCYTHSSPTNRTIVGAGPAAAPPPSGSQPAAAFVNPAIYQNCPCPMQTCPKNVHTGPLTGDGGKRSTSIVVVKDTVPLSPVKLALPLEPASATGPPSPARGSAGMAPPPSPAGATYHHHHHHHHHSQQQLHVVTATGPPSAAAPKQETNGEKRKARVGKAMVRNHMIQQNTMLLMCNPNVLVDETVKREPPSPKDKDGVEKKEINDNLIGQHEPNDADDDDEVDENEKKMETKLKIEEINDVLEPCVKTVAENVKVKNMKRKASIAKEDVEAEGTVAKKVKNEQYANGSYKDLIRKYTKPFRITNGKRRLLRKDEEGRKQQTTKTAASKRRAVKQETLDEPVHKRTRQCGGGGRLTTTITTTKTSKRRQLPKRRLTIKNSVDRTIESVISATTTTTNRTKSDKKSTNSLKNIINNNTNNSSNHKNECRKAGGRRKSKCKEEQPQTIVKVPRKSIQLPRWSNGWTWEGQPFETKVFLNSDETTVIRKCYPAMRHEEGDLIQSRDCVLLKAGPRRNELPFVAKIAYLWENPDDGEMMMSLLWYYRPEHTEQGRLPSDRPDEVFASRHKDSNSVACIDDKCYVLTFHEYCRYRKELRRLEEGLEETLHCISIPEPYPRTQRLPPIDTHVPAELVFFCRKVYDFRQKRIVKNPN